MNSDYAYASRNRIKKRQVFILIILSALLIFANYAFLDKQVENLLDESKYVTVARVIDGDTIVTKDDVHVRLLGINTPESGEFFYQEAKDFLNNSIFNKTIKLEFTGDRYDKYGRNLAYIFLEDENINIKIVEKGLANYYFYSGMDKYSGDLKKAWNKCLNNSLNLCEKSDNICRNCVEINPNNIVNTCSFTCNISGWQIKGEGRQKFIFNGTIKADEMAGFEIDTTNSGGSLFLRDDDGKLVKWVIY